MICILLFTISAAQLIDKHYVECDIVCNNMSRYEALNLDVCVSMCDRMMKYHEQGIRSELLSELSAERQRMLDEIAGGRVDNCSPDMSKMDLLEYKLKSTEIDTKYIAQMLNDLTKSSEKNNHDTTVVMILEVVVIVIYLLKPCVMYFIQAKYHADKPHDGCRGVDDRNCGTDTNKGSVDVQQDSGICIMEDKQKSDDEMIKRNRSIVEFV